MRERRGLALEGQGSFQMSQENSHGRPWGYIKPLPRNPTIMFKSAQARTVRLTKTGPFVLQKQQLEMHLMCVGNDRLSPGGPSAPMARTVRRSLFPTTQNNHRVCRFKMLAGGPSAPRAGPSAVHFFAHDRNIKFLDQQHKSRRTVRPRRPDRPP